MKLTKQEALVLLSFAKANRNCDVDFASLFGADEGSHWHKIYKTRDPKNVKRTWNTIIKKLKTVK
jgi:hypothetical protein